MCPVIVHYIVFLTTTRVKGGDHYWTTDKTRRRLDNRFGLTHAHYARTRHVSMRAGYKVTWYILLCNVIIYSASLILSTCSTILCRRLLSTCGPILYRRLQNASSTFLLTLYDRSTIYREKWYRWHCFSIKLLILMFGWKKMKMYN